MILGHELYGSQWFVDTKNTMRAVINYGSSGHVGMCLCKFFLRFFLNLHGGIHSLIRVCARGDVLCGSAGIPSDYFEGTLETFDPAKPDKEGQVWNAYF